MKKILTLIVMLAAVAAASAKSVVFTLSDGTLVYYLLGGETNPVMKFVDGKVVVNADTYEFSEVKNFYISATDDPTSVEEVKALPSKFDGKTLVVPTENANVAVFDASGKKVKASISVANGSTLVDLSSLPKGVYVIKVGGSSIKVMCK